MNSKQTLMLLISIALCLAIYPFFDIALVIIILTTAFTAALTIISSKSVGIIPFFLSLAGAMVFKAVFGMEYMIPGLFTAVASLAGFVMGISIKGKWALQGILLFSGGVFLFAIIGAIFAVNSYYNTDYINTVITTVKEITYANISPYIGILIDGTSGELKQAIDTIYNYITTLIPSLMIITCGALAYISFGTARFILKKIKIIFPLLPDRRHLIMSRGSGWIMIMVWLLNMFVANERIGYALTNISVIISSLFFACGISLALYMIQYKIKRTGIKWMLRIIMFTSILSFGSMFVSELFIMAAIIDSVWNLRRLGYQLHQ